MHQAPLAVGSENIIFVDNGGRLLTCGREGPGVRLLLGHAVDPAADPNVRREIGPPTPVPSMQDRRIVSVAANDLHCLALSAESAWGDGAYGALGHGDEQGDRAVPSRIETLSSIERIAAAPGQIGRAWRSTRKKASSLPGVGRAR
jgi:alpha-tubulin suppressor-like RCC1 family protein